MASNTEVPLPAPTQVSTKSTTVYHWVILFLYDENTEFPFSCEALATMKNSDFPFHAIEGSMDASMRNEPIPLSTFGGQMYCIFAKIEKGKKNAC